MSNEGSIFDEKYFEAQTREEWKQTGAWARFIGVALIIFSAMTVLMLVLVLLNQEASADEIMQLIGISQESEAFLTQGGIWLFIFLILIVVTVLVYNAICLMRFNKNTKRYAIHPNEELLNRSFFHLKRYFTITLVLGFVSLFISLLSTLFTINA